jgi:hypothetical protein
MGNAAISASGGTASTYFGAPVFAVAPMIDWTYDF